MMENLQLDFVWEKLALLDEIEIILIIGGVAMVFSAVPRIARISVIAFFCAILVYLFLSYMRSEGSNITPLLGILMIGAHLKLLCYTPEPINMDLAKKELFMHFECYRSFIEGYFKNLNEGRSKPLSEIADINEVRRIIGIPCKGYLNADDYDTDQEFRETVMKAQYEMCLYAEENQAEIEHHFRRIDQGVIKPFSSGRVFQDDLQHAMDYILSRVYKRCGLNG
ncbi:hypothetical protein [Candidatus Odyssella thessalonicensis]|uniref:hypothetical protein n=1 Tax=Candidatus Odyssella thessalonicensis TaxID=84647 RepID=UPI000225B506|nr:hypothetical protein [Candidatus Odyssella thessalonicensis]